MNCKKPSLKGMNHMNYLGHFAKDKHIQRGHNDSGSWALQDLMPTYTGKAKDGTIIMAESKPQLNDAIKDRNEGKTKDKEESSTLIYSTDDEDRE